MSWELLIPIVLGIGLVSFSLLVVLSRHLFRSAVFLALTLVFTAFFYIFLGAELLAGIQILLYAGGVITLIIFVILLTERVKMERLEETHRSVIPALLASSSVFFALTYFTWSSPRIRSLAVSFHPPGFGVSQELAESIFRKWLLPFEVLSLLLLAAIVGALVLARRDEEET